MIEIVGLSLPVLMLILYICIDVNYFIRCAFTFISLRLFQSKRKVTDVTTIFGLCTTQDVDIFLRHMNNARYLRELNFASVHYYSLNNLYNLVREQGGSVVQGATNLRYRRSIHLFQAYKIHTKLLWWDDKAIYLEQQFVTLTDGFVNAVAISKHCFTHCNVIDLIQNLLETTERPELPEDLKLWLEAIDISSHRLKAGWSSSKTIEPLRPEEQEAIISVIRRNEEIEIAERQRVGRLVERVEKIKLHAVERGPNCCRLCGDTFGLLRPQRIICEDCRKSVCTKCSVDINIRYQNSERMREIWLCRICSETREMWKKSGAWFFKGLPNYDKPRSASATPTATPKASRAVKSCHGTPTRTARLKKLTIRVQDSSSSSGGGSNSSEPEDEVDGAKARPTGARLQRDESFRLRAYGSIRSFIDGGERKLSTSFFFNRQQQQQQQQQSTPDYDNVSISNASTVAQLRRDNSFMRRSSISSSWSFSDSSGSGNSVIQSQQQSQIAQQQHCRDPLLGWLELSISYRESFHSLDCTMVRARDLPAMDAAGLADPYCKLNIVTPEAHTKYTRWQRTKTVHKTRNPDFNETLQFVGVEPLELGNSLLYVALFDDDKYGHDFLGAAKVCLSTVHSTSSYRISVPLGVEDQYSSEAELAQSWPNGKMLISLCYNTKRRALVVNVKQCINLLAMDNNGSSDPFVKLQLKPDAHKNKKHKTSVKWRTLNPIYNEEFYFEASPHDLNKEMLILTVWDKDLGKSNDFLGSLQLGSQSKGDRLQQWLDCIRLPDHFHEKWHCLAPENPTH